MHKEGVQVGNAARRITIVPFETAVAVLLIASGGAGLAHVGVIDPVGALLPHWESLALYAMTIFTGGLMVAGIATAARRIEMAGLLFLLAVITDRFILYGYYLGFHADFAVNGIFDTATVWAALTRHRTVRKRQVIVRAQSGQVPHAGD